MYPSLHFSFHPEVLTCLLPLQLLHVLVLTFLLFSCTASSAAVNDTVECLVETKSAVEEHDEKKKGYKWNTEAKTENEGQIT